MTFEFNFGDLWWPAIVIGVISYFVLSMIWYTPRIFGNMWMKDEGLDMERAREIGSPMLYLTTALMALISNISMALILDNIGEGLVEGLVTGLIVGFGITAMVSASHYTFAGRPLRLTLIQLGHSILLVTVSGVIIGTWTG